MSDGQEKNESNEQTTKTDNIKQEIKKREEDKIQTREKLEDEYKSTIEELEKFVEETKLEQTRFESTKNQISEHIEIFKRNVTTFLSSSEKSITSNFNEFTEIVSRIILWFRVSIIVFSAAFLAIYFGLYNKSFAKDAFLSIGGLNFDQQSTVTVGSLFLAVAALFSIVYLGSRSIRNKIEKSRGVVNQNISDIKDKRPETPANYLDNGGFFNYVLRRAPIFDSRVKSIVKYSREFIPILDKLYTIMERDNLQNQFRKSVKNALNSYGLFENPSDELLDTINTFSTPSNSELDWINESASKISFAFKNSGISIDEKIIKLAYYDYTNSDHLADAWDNILSEKEKLLSQLSYLLASRTLKIDVTGSYGALSELLEKIDVFRLPEFQKDYYNFFVEFKRRKTHMKTAVSQMGFDSEVVAPLIETFVPPTLDRDTWDEKLAGEVCDILNIDTHYLLLFYYSRIGFEKECTRTWNEVKDSDDLFSCLIKKLDEKRLLSIPDAYRKNLDIPTIKKIALKLPHFDFYKFNEKINSKFKSIDDVKTKITQILEDINPKWTTTEFRNDLGSFVPTSEDIIVEITNHLENFLHVDPDLIILFYGTKHDQTLAERYYKDIKSSKADKLSQFLIDYNLIEIEKTNYEINNKDNLASILKQFPKLDLLKIQNTYQQYSHLLEISKNLVQFLHDEEVIKKEKFDFNELITILPNPEEDRLGNILNISSNLVKSNISANDLDSITKACTCLFLYKRDDISARRACHIIQRNDIASRILYYNMEKNGDENLGTKYPFKNIIDMTFSNATSKFDYLTEFQLGLGNGLLYTSKKDMMSHRLNSVQEQLEKISEIESELNEMEDSVKTVLNTEFDAYPGFLEYAIQAELVKAYVITTKSNGPALKKILDAEIIYDAAKEILGDINLDSFLIIGQPGKDPSLGSHTRIGIVPFGMTFENFSEKFQAIYDRAVEKFLEKNASYVKSDFQLNIFRFLSYPATFKRIRFQDDTTGQEDFESDDPVRIIEKLIKGRFPAQDNLKLILTFSKQESGIAAKDILKKIFDGKTLYSFVQKELVGLVSNIEPIEKMTNNSQFDVKFYHSYTITKFSELASVIYELRKSSSTDDHIIENMSNKITDILKKSKSEITPEDIKQLSRLFFNKLIKFGKIFSN